MQEQLTIQAPWKWRFGLFWVSQTIARFGGAFSGFALVWWVTKTYGTATALVSGTLITLLPGILLGPLIGTIVDRNSRRFFIVMSNLVYAASAAVLFGLSYYDQLQLWHLYMVMFVNSLAGQFHFMAINAATAQLVPEDQLQRVSGLGQLREGAVSIIAPPAGALLLEYLHLDGVLFLEICTGVAAAMMMLSIAIPKPTVAADAPKLSVLADLRAGLRYVVSWQGLMVLMLVSMLLNLLFYPAFSLLPLLVKNHFHGGALQLAWFEMAFGIGMISGSVVLSVWGGFKVRIHTMLLGLVGMGISMTILATASETGLYIGIAAMALFGILQPITNGPLFAILQSTVPKEMQGR
ncbi:MAG: MFS transporter, partial [Chloroflexi bacterium]